MSSIKTEEQIRAINHEVYLARHRAMAIADREAGYVRWQIDNGGIFQTWLTVVTEDIEASDDSTWRIVRIEVYDDAEREDCIHDDVQFHFLRPDSQRSIISALSDALLAKRNRARVVRRTAR